MLAFFLAFCLAFYLAFHLAVGPLSWEGPQLRPSGGHWGRELALELSLLGSGAGEEELARRSLRGGGGGGPTKRGTMFEI